MVVQLHTVNAPLRAHAVQRVPYLPPLHVVAPHGDPEGRQAHQTHPREAQQVRDRAVVRQRPQGRVAVFVRPDRLDEGDDEEEDGDRREEDRRIEVDVERVHVPVDAGRVPADLDGLAHMERPVPDQANSEEDDQPREDPRVVEGFCGYCTEKTNSKCNE